MKKIVFIIVLTLSFTLSHSQKKEGKVIEDEILLESTETDEEETVYESRNNVNSYNKRNNTVDIVTGEIDNTLLIFKGKNTSLYGLKDKSGKVLVKPIFYSINSYSSTKERIKASFKYGQEGLIDSKGNIIIPFEYSSIYKRNNLFKASKNGQTHIFDYYGNSLLKGPYESVEISKQHFKVKNSGLYGILNLNGEVLFPIEYENINYYENDDWFLVQKNGISNLLNSNGKNVFGKKYSSVSKLDYKFRYILVEKNGKWGIISKSDQEITPFIFDTVEANYDNTRFIVKQNGKWGIYDVYFNLFLVEPNYISIKKLSNKYYLLSDTSSKVIVNLLLNKKVDFSNYDNINSYTSKELITVEKNKLKGVFNIDLEKLIIPQKYSYIEISAYYTKCNIPNSKLSDIYDLNGKMLFKNVSYIKSLNNNYHYKRITSEGKLGVLKKNKIVIDAKYDYIEGFKNTTYVFVKSGTKNGLISLIDGAFLIPLNTNKITVNTNKNSINWKKKNYKITFNKLVEIK